MKKVVLLNKNFLFLILLLLKLSVFAQADSEDLICVTGSIIFIGELLDQWDNLNDQLIAKRGKQDAAQGKRGRHSKI